MNNNKGMMGLTISEITFFFPLTFGVIPADGMCQLDTCTGSDSPTSTGMVLGEGSLKHYRP